MFREIEPPPPPRYRVIEIGSNAYALNNRGQVAGVEALWDNGRRTPLFKSPPLQGSTGLRWAWGINNAGAVVGEDFGRPFLWRNGKMVYLPLRPGDEDGMAYAINNAGFIVGMAGGGRFVLWRSGTKDYRILLQGKFVERSAINASGQVVGGAVSVEPGKPAARFPVLWEHGKMREFPALGGCRFTDIRPFLHCHKRQTTCDQVFTGNRYLPFGIDRSQHSKGHL